MATRRTGRGGGADPAGPSAGDRPSVEVVQEDGFWVNLSKQAKFIVLGGLPVWYLDVPGSLIYVLKHGGDDWTRSLALVAVAFLLATMALFAYVILLPARGFSPNYADWNRDPHLRSMIPALTVSIIGGYIALLLLLSPFCNPTPSLASVLPATLGERISSAATSAGASAQELPRLVQGLAGRASSVLYKGLHRPAVAVKSSSSWFSSGRGGSGAVDTKSLLSALKLKDTATLGKQLQVPARRLNEFGSSLERQLKGVDLQLLQTKLTQLQQAAREASDERHSPYWWAKRGAWGWGRALVGSGCSFLLIFGAMGLLGLAGSTAGAAQRRRDKQGKASL